jgi:hypothetical protein
MIQDLFKDISIRFILRRGRVILVRLATTYRGNKQMCTWLRRENYSSNGKLTITRAENVLLSKEQSA